MATLDILQKLYEQRDTEDGHADLEIRCGDQIQKVHKAVICAASPFFQAACTSPFEESKKGIINMLDDNPEAVAAMIRFFYFNRYGDDVAHDDDCPRKENRLSSCSCRNLLPLHVNVHGLAGKYTSSELKTMASYYFEVAVSANPGYFGAPFREAIRLAYATSPESNTNIRGIILRATGDCLDQVSTPEFAQLMKEVPGFARDAAVTFSKTIIEKSKIIQQHVAAKSELKRKVDKLTPNVAKEDAKGGAVPKKPRSAKPGLPGKQIPIPLPRVPHPLDPK